MVKKGDIAFSGKRKYSFYSRTVMKITKSRWSHCFFLLGDICGELSVFESELIQSTVPFDREYIKDNNDYYEVWRPLKASEEDVDRAGKYCYHEYSGDLYGFLQIPWFIWRVLAGRWFGLKPKKNWSTSGVICSELLFEYLYHLGGEYRELVKDLGPDITSPQDLYVLVLSRPDLFEMILKRD